MKPCVKGFVAQTSQEVLKIVPNDDLKAKIEIDSRSIGFVKIGQQAAAAIITFIPVTILMIFFQQYITRVVLSGSDK